MGTAEAIKISLDKEKSDKEKLDKEKDNKKELDDRNKFANAYGQIAAALVTLPQVSQTPQTPTFSIKTRSILKWKALAEKKLTTPKTKRYGT